MSSKPIDDASKISFGHIYLDPVDPSVDPLQPLISHSTSADLFLNELCKDQKIDLQGSLKEGIQLPQMPPLNRESMRRLNDVLDRSIKFNIFLLQQEISFRDILLKFDLSKGRITLVGGIVPWILGSQGFYQAGVALLDEERFKRIYPQEVLEKFDRGTGDIDVRFLEELDDPQMLAEAWLKSIASNFVPFGYSEEEVCNELRKEGGPFAVFRYVFNVDHGTKQRQAFQINHYNGTDFELDLFIASFLKNDSLLTLQDLTLDITDYLTGCSTEVIPSGKSSQGWKGVVALLGKLIQFESLTPQAWARAMSKKIMGYRGLNSFPEELYKEMKPRAVANILQGVISNHMQQNPVVAFMFLIDCASDLLSRGIHRLDVDRMTRNIQIIGILPIEFQAISRARETMSMEMILSFIRLIHQSEKIDSAVGLIWMLDGCESIIHIELERAIENLISFEMQLRESGQDHLNQLVDLFRVFQMEVTSEPFIILSVIERRIPKLIPIASRFYFRHREKESRLAFSLIRFLLNFDVMQAVHLFRAHLSHVEKMEQDHVEMLERLIPRLFHVKDQIHLIERINIVISIVQTICRQEPEVQEQVFRMIEKILSDAHDGNLILMDFIESSYLQNQNESHLLGNFLLKRLQAGIRPGEHSERIAFLTEQKERRELESDALRKNLQGMLTFFEQWVGKRGSKQEDAIKQKFLEFMKFIAVSDRASLPVYINKIRQLVPKMLHLFQEIPSILDEAILDVVEGAFRSNYQSVNLFELYENVIRAKSISLRAVTLIVKGIQEERLSMAPQQFLQTICKYQGSFFRLLSENKRDEEILLLLTFINVQFKDLENDPEIYFSIYLKALLVVLKRNPVYSDGRKINTVLQTNFPSTPLTSKYQQTLIELIACLQDHHMVNESAFWILCYLKQVKWKSEGVTKELAERILDWTGRIVSSQATSEAFSILNILFSHLPFMQDAVFELILEIPDQRLQGVAQEAAQMIQKAIGLKPAHKTSILFITKVKALTRALLQAPSRENYSTALDFIEYGFEDSFEVQAQMMEQSQLLPLKLKWRGWKLFRIRFSEYLKSEKINVKEAVVMRCIRASKSILQVVSVNRYRRAKDRINDSLAVYNHLDAPLKEWLNSAKQQPVFEDIESLLMSRISLLNLEESNTDFLLEICSFRSKLLIYDGPEVKIKEVLHSVDGVLAGHLLNHKETALYIRGLKLFQSYLLDTKENTPQIVDRLVSAIRRSASLKDFDKIECESLLDEICGFFWERKYSKQDEERIQRAFRDCPEGDSPRRDYIHLGPIEINPSVYDLLKSLVVVAVFFSLTYFVVRQIDQAKFS